MVEKVNYKKLLLDMFDKAVAGDCSVKDFEDSFYFFFLEDVPADELGDEAESFFCEIQERLEYVAGEPCDEDRKYGYVTAAEYLQWLRTFVKENRNLVR